MAPCCNNTQYLAAVPQQTVLSQADKPDFLLFSMIAFAALTRVVAAVMCEEVKGQLQNANRREPGSPVRSRDGP